GGEGINSCGAQRPGPTNKHGAGGTTRGKAVKKSIVIPAEPCRRRGPQSINTDCEHSRGVPRRLQYLPIAESSIITVFACYAGNARCAGSIRVECLHIPVPIQTITRKLLCTQLSCI